MTLKIISPDEVLYQGEAKAVTLPGTMGAFTVLNNHASLVSTLVAGKLSFTDASGAVQTREISGGVADVDSNVVSVCLY
ncbi:MAG: F0F1 ATP synthase subunit epsilon [Muribaculaceae bacterium]|nr:F0F1 ATP synthase subunit epsilon [Muribaculaceae bacterium]